MTHYFSTVRDLAFNLAWRIGDDKSWLLFYPIPEVRGSNLVIGKNLFILNICLLSTVYWKDKNKEKEAGIGPFFKKSCLFFINYDIILSADIF